MTIDDSGSHGGGEAKAGNFLFFCCCCCCCLLLLLFFLTKSTIGHQREKPVLLRQWNKTYAERKHYLVSHWIERVNERLNEPTTSSEYNKENTNFQCNPFSNQVRSLPRRIFGCWCADRFSKLLRSLSNLHLFLPILSATS